MNGEAIKEFLVTLGFEVDEAGYKKFVGGVGKATKSVAAFAAGVVAATATVYYGVAKVADEFDKLNDLSERINAPVKDIQEFGYALTLSGSSAEAANASLENLYQNARLAANGMGRGVEVFKKLGINVKDANGKLKTSTQLMDEVAVAMKTVEGGEGLAQRLGLDATVVNALKKDLTGLKAEFADLYKTVGIDSQKAAEQSAEFNDTLDRLKYTTGAILKSILIKFMPQFTKSMDQLRKNLIILAPKIINAITPIISFILRMADAITTLAVRLVELIAPVIDMFVRLHDATSGWSTAILGALAAWRLLNLGFLATPIGLIITFGIALLALYDDMKTFFEGGKSYFNWSWMTDLGYALWDFVYGVQDAFTAMWKAIKWIANIWLTIFLAPFRIIDATINGFIDLMGRAWKAIQEVGEGIVKFFSGDKSMNLNINTNVNRATNGGVPMASPFGAGAGGQNVTQKTDIIIQGSSDPNATARAVAGQQTRVNADMTRNLKGAAR